MQRKTTLPLWRRFCRDREGVALVEFAMALPVMLVAYLGTVEVAQLVMINRKVTQLTSALADLTARVQSVAPADVENIFDAAQTILMPYDPGNARMVLASVVVDGSGVGRVCWSNQRNGTALARGATVTLPDSVKVANTSVIMARASYDYTPAIGYVLTGAIALGDDPIYARPRNGLAGGTLSIEQVKRTNADACPTF
ncbi:TadE/TadG family type IV pilus assembly protein [Bosea sp. MMO-172]|uniref:TadE/TadG family type IV pilus assembly protein n=1 Tax=Bosea sp. MMO-172 TaxID=3127885 RepID=UPI003017A981